MRIQHPLCKWLGRAPEKQKVLRLASHLRSTRTVSFVRWSASGCSIGRVKAVRRPATSLQSFDFTIPWGSVCNERLQEFVCCCRHLVHGAIEGEFVGLGGLGESAQFADELQRRRTDFFVRRRRFEVVQRLNISTHSICSPPNLSLKLCGS